MISKPDLPVNPSDLHHSFGFNQRPRQRHKGALESTLPFLAVTSVKYCSSQTRCLQRFPCIQKSYGKFSPAGTFHVPPPITASVPGRLTRLSDVNQAQKVHQFEEHDHQADDANSLEPLRLPPHTHLLLVLYFFSRPFLYFLPLHCRICCTFWSDQ